MAVSSKSGEKGKKKDSRSVSVTENTPVSYTHLEAKALIAGMVGAKPEQAIVYGNSSLNIMYDQVCLLYTSHPEGYL